MSIFRSAAEAQFTFTLYKTEFSVIEFTAKEKLSSLFNVTIRIASESKLTVDEMIGREGFLKIYGKDKPRYFHGMVEYFKIADISGRFFIYDMILSPLIALLELKKDIRIFQQKSTQDIIESVLKDTGITSDRFRFELKAKYEKRAYCVQYRETDLHFISRLLAEEGIFYYFDHKKDNHTLVFGDSDVNYPPIDGDATICFNPQTSLMPDDEFISTFSISHRIQSGKTALKEYNFKHPSLNLTSEEHSKAYEKLEIYDYPGLYETTEKGKKLAKVRLEERTQFKETGQGTSICPRLTPGFTYQLKDHPINEMNRGYVLVEVIHKGSQTQVLEELSTTGDAASYENEFLVIPSKVPFRPDVAIKKPVVEGVQTAIVTGPKGEEIYVDKYGRVKVQFHWDRDGRYDEKSSCWIRVSQLSAGKNWGCMFIPRVGQEVIVDFVAGDPDRPIITGCVYHGTNPPPYELPKDRTKSTIKSNTSPDGGGFNEVRLEDKKGEEQIFIHAEKNKDIRIKNDRLEWVGNDSHLIVEKKEHTKVGGDRHLTIKGDFNRKVEGAISTEVSNDVQEKINGRLASEVGSEIHLKAGGKVIIEAGSQITLKVGGNFVNIASSGIHISGVVLNLNSGGKPGTGSGASPAAPLLPLEADNAKPGKSAIAPDAPQTPSTQADILKKSAQSGKPFCKVCNA